MPIDVIPHLPILGSLPLRWADESACAAFAQSLAALPDLRDAFMALEGPLGAGKTTFVRHLLRALGVQGRVKSPTYAVMEPYALPGFAVSHFDFYRFTDAREWDDAGFRDVFAEPGLKIAEWPDKAAARLPVADLTIVIEPLDEERRDVAVTAGTERGLRMIGALR